MSSGARRPGLYDKYDDSHRCGSLVSVGHVGGRVPVVLFGLYALYGTRSCEGRALSQRRICDLVVVGL